jgi:hypothetical protein
MSEGTPSEDGKGRGKILDFRFLILDFLMVLAEVFKANKGSQAAGF